ncbi:MAG: hypothetical protein WBF53_08510 [Litorimonas sp.]
MTKPKVDVQDLSLFLTRRGYVAIQCDGFEDAAMESRLFGDFGECPPTPLGELTRNALSAINESPDVSDIDDLGAFAEALRNSLLEVENALARLTRR